MTDPEANRVFAPTSIFRETLVGIQSEANREKELHPKERKPSAAKLIERAWAAFIAAGGVSGLDREQYADVAAFIALLQSGNEQDIAQVLPTVREYRIKESTDAKQKKPKVQLQTRKKAS